MSYSWTATYGEIYHKGMDAYRSGNKDFNTWYNEEEKAFLAGIGCSLQEIFDLVEDNVVGGEPDFGTALLLAGLRREYFLEKQKGEQLDELDSATLPPKNEEVEGIRWLPRIIEKAKRKLTGQMDADLMYSCGGDRAFLKKYDFHPAEFLTLVRDSKDDQEVIDAVKAKG